MRELTSSTWIVAKGVMLLVIALSAAGLVFGELPTPRIAVLLAILVWASCRFYYFLFYVLEKYVDPDPAPKGTGYSTPELLEGVRGLSSLSLSVRFRCV